MQDIKTNDNYLDSEYAIMAMNTGLNNILNDKIYNFTYLTSQQDKFKQFRKSLTSYAMRLVENYVIEKQLASDNSIIEI